MRSIVNSYMARMAIKYGLIIIPLLLIQGGMARVYTSSNGDTVEATFVSANEKTVTLKLKKNGREYTLEHSKLSEADQKHIAQLAKDAAEQLASKNEKLDLEKQQLAKKESEKLVKQAAVAKITEFVKSNKGKQVGNGECWTLAEEAFKHAGLQRGDRPGIREWGRLVDWKKEEVQPGDVIELQSASFPKFRTGPNHTGVIDSKGKRGKFTVLEQNVGGKKIVMRTDYDLRKMSKGTVQIYRYE